MSVPCLSVRDKKIPRNGPVWWWYDQFDLLYWKKCVKLSFFLVTFIYYILLSNLKHRLHVLSIYSGFCRNLDFKRIFIDLRVLLEFSGLFFHILGELISNITTGIMFIFRFYRSNLHFVITRSIWPTLLAKVG